MADLSLIMKATIVLTLTLVAVRLLHRMPASVRSLLLASSFAVLLVLPLAVIAIPPRTVEIPAASMPGLLLEDNVFEALPATAAPPGTNVAPLPASNFRLPSLGVTVRLAWAAGTLLFLSPMVVALWRLRQLRLRGLPWLEGRTLVAEVAAHSGVARPVDVFLHEALAAPMTCGLFRPTVGLPIDAPRWTKADLRHALVHEMEHVRRRDWPVHLMARLVCALYWFHPLAWIAWRQLSLESERACDDAVLHGTEGTAYAEQLVNLARRLSKHSPVPMLSMADRSNLSTRVNAVLDTHVARGRAGARVASLIIGAAAIAAALISPLQAVTRQVTPNRPAAPGGSSLTFEVASVRPNAPGDPGRAFDYKLATGTLILVNQTLKTLISTAYSEPFGFWFPDERISGGPDWLDEARFTIQARAGRAVTAGEMGAMLRTLLAERFRLDVRVDARQEQIYELVRSKSDGRLGPQLRPYIADGETLPRMGIGGGPGKLALQGAPIDLLVGLLPEYVGRTVVDRTGLTGAFDGTLTWAPSPNEVAGRPDAADRPTEVGVSIFTALQEQLGLKLESRRGPVAYLVIERAEPPTPNDEPGVQPPAAADLRIDRGERPTPVDAAVVPAARTEPQAPAVAFEVASVKQNRSGSTASSSRSGTGSLSVTNQTALALIVQAYGVRRDRLAGGPAWLDTDRFDIAARAPDNTPDNQIALMLRSLLAERFQLSVRTEMRDQPVYALVLANRDGRLGPNLKASTECDAKALSGTGGVGIQSLPRTDQPATQIPCGMRSVSDARGVFMTAGARPLSDLARALDGRADRFVVDRTGLSGTYSFDLRFGRPDVQGGAGQDSNLPIIFTALQEQLGLKLESERGAVGFLVIDRLERPTEN